MDMYQKREMRKNKKLEDNEQNYGKKNAINWYPGHMAKTKREIKEKIDLIDIVYEIIDARMPYSSKIKDLDLLLKDKPRIIIVTKYDLCDKEETDKFINEYKKNYEVITTNLNNDKDIVKNIIKLTEKIVGELNKKRIEKGLTKRSYRSLVVGVPNVGKSTFINRMAGRNVQQTGNKAGVTKNLTWIRVNKEIELLDSPGILWPKIDEAEVGYNLASLTSIKEEILDKEDISKYILSVLLEKYPKILEEKYKITSIDFDNIYDTFDLIAKKRGALLKGGIADYDKVYSIIINDLKNGTIKNVTFDTFK